MPKSGASKSMDQVIIVKGSASGKILKKITLLPEDYDLSLMEILLKNNIPVAYSCKGEGICKKCKVYVDNIEILSCQKWPQNLLTNNNSVIIELTYL